MEARKPHFKSTDRTQMAKQNTQTSRDGWALGNLLITGGLYMETAWRKGLHKNAVVVVVVGGVGGHGSMAGFLLYKTFKYLHRTEREQKTAAKTSK